MESSSVLLPAREGTSLWGMKTGKVEYFATEFIGNLFLIGGLLGLGWGVETITPRNPEFFEGDLTLSRSHPTNTISNAALAGIAAALPLLLSLSLDAITWWRRRRSSKIDSDRPWFDAKLTFSCAFSLSLCVAITNVIKTAAGVPRPSFFARCDYKGYASAIATSNISSAAFTAYLGAIKQGAPGSVAFCAAPAAAVNDAHRSFPSGHASLSFAGLGFLFLTMRAAFLCRRYWFSLAALLAGSPLAVATYIAITRLIDGAHSTADVSAGAAVGAACAAVAWANYRAHEPNWQKTLSLWGAEPPPRDSSPV
jgi:membrane-associated phospholipid phosphatase